jgi:hypothetical protein
MNLTKQMQQLVLDAQAAGYTVRNDHEACLDIVKLTKHTKPRVIKGLRIWADGNAIDATMDLAAAKAIKTQKEWRKFLGI